MKDRIPVNPGRVLINPEDGSAPFYATMTRADNPTQEGTPLSKATILKDSTAALFGLGSDAVPDDVFSLLKTIMDNHEAAITNRAKIATGSYVGTGKSGKSNKCSLTFDFKPEIVIVLPILIATRSNTSSFSFYYSNGTASITTEWTNNGISWFQSFNNGVSHADYQCNAAGKTYYYIALGT